MSTMIHERAVVNPRDSWPTWTDAEHWNPTPIDPEAYVPTVQEEAEAAALLNEDEPFPDRMVPTRRDRRMARPKVVYGEITLTDADHYPPGCVS